MDDKIKAWIREGERLMSEFTAVLVDGFSDCAALVKADAAMRAHLRTTPEGFRLVKEHENEALRKDAERYRWLRSRDLDTIDKGGVFAGMTPRNIVLNEEHLDTAIDAALKEQNKC